MSPRAQYPISRRAASVVAVPPSSGPGDPHRRLNALAAEGWGLLLKRYPWDYFVTITYRSPQSPESVHKGFCRWLSLWMEQEALIAGDCEHVPNVYAHDGRPKLRGRYVNLRRRGRCWPVYVLGIEPHKSGRLHAHAVLRWVTELRRPDVRLGWAIAFKMFGRTKIEVPRCQAAIGVYCTKYVCKFGGELVLSRSFSASSPLFACVEGQSSGRRSAG